MKNNKRTLIVSGGIISFDFVEKYLKQESFDYVIAADSGLTATHRLGLEVDYILGDFDSVPPEIIEEYKNKREFDESFEIRKYNPIKDYTDTQIAIKTAINLGSTEIVLIGGSGSRIDHLISNIQNFVLALEKDIKCSLVDENNKLYLINKPTTIYKQKSFGTYISLLPLTPIVEKVILKGFKYSLDEYDIRIGESIGVSNEIVDDEARIIFNGGILIVVETRD